MKFFRSGLLTAISICIIGTQAVHADDVLKATVLFNETGMSALHKVLRQESDGNTSPQQIAAKPVIIDSQVRYLGGDRVSRKVWPTMKFPFTVVGSEGNTHPVLTIGSLHGIADGDTPSPVTIQLNGYRIAHMVSNGENIRISVPPEAINPNGANVLQIRAGYHVSDGDTITYDAIELKDLALRF